MRAMWSLCNSANIAAAHSRPLQIFYSAAAFLDMPVRPEDPLPGLKMATARGYMKKMSILIGFWTFSGRSSEVLELKREVWCEGGDLNPYALSSTSPSN